MSFRLLPSVISTTTLCHFDYYPLSFRPKGEIFVLNPKGNKVVYELKFSMITVCRQLPVIRYKSIVENKKWKVNLSC
jgi:hypothetical protein